MKRIFVSLLVVLSVLMMTACTDDVNVNAEDSGNTISVVTTIFPPYDIVKNIAGDSADVKMLLNPGEETHSFEPSAKDILAIQEADLFIYVGGDDVWVDSVLESLDKKPETIKLVDVVDTVEEEVKEGMEHVHSHDSHEGEEYHENHEGEGHHEDHEGEGHHEDHEGEEHHENHEGEGHHEDHEGEEHHEDHEGEGHHKDHEGEEHHENHEHKEGQGVDEHVWLSIANAKVIAEVLKDKLVEIDAENKATYEEHFSDYTAKLTELEADFNSALTNRAKNVIVVADRFPFRYLVKDYNIDYYAAFTGCSSEAEMSASTMKFLIEKVREENVPVVFKIEFSNGKTAEAIAQETGSKVLELHSLHNLSAKDFKDGEDYISVMRRNLEVLKEALN